VISGVVGEADVISAWRAGARTVAIAPGAVVTVLAREAAERLGVALQVGPMEQPARAKPDGATITRRLLYRRHPGWVAPEPLRGRAPVRLPRLAIVGAGGVGANTAHLAAVAGVADAINLIDLVPGLAESVALDLMHASGITNSDSRVSGGTGIDLLAGADVVVITAGRPRSPGMSRKDLVEVNGRVIRTISEQVAAHAPDAIVLVVTNPLDEMTEAALVTTGFPRQRVLGMAGTLDSSRFRYQLAMAAGVKPADVSAFTLGSHGEEMVPVTSQATVAGKPVETVLDPAAIARAVKDTIAGGAAVVALRRTGSATIAPAHAILEVLDAIRGARAGPIPVSVRLEGEYGIDGVVVGVPVVLGRSGVIEVVELTLSQEELAGLRRSAQAVRNRVSV
jgi:malate dehydrogenase